MTVVSFHSAVTQDDPKGHSLGKPQNESLQPFAGTVKVSELHTCGKPLPPSPRQRQAEQPGGSWGLGSEWRPREHGWGQGRALGGQVIYGDQVVAPEVRRHLEDLPV